MNRILMMLVKKRWTICIIQGIIGMSLLFTVVIHKNLIVGVTGLILCIASFPICHILFNIHLNKDVEALK